MNMNNTMSSASSSMHLQGAITAVPSHESDETDDAIYDLLHNANNNNNNKLMTSTGNSHNEDEYQDQDQSNISEWGGSAASPKSKTGNTNLNPNLSLNLKEMNDSFDKQHYMNSNSNSNSHPTFKTDTNHFQLSPKTKLKMNPRDAASPRRSRIITKRKEYDTGACANAASSYDGNSGNKTNSNSNTMSPYLQSYSHMDGAGSVSQHSYKTESTMHSASVGGLPYMENMSISPTPSRSRRQNATGGAGRHRNAASPTPSPVVTNAPAPLTPAQGSLNPNWSQAHPQSSTASRSSHASHAQSQSQSASVSASISSKQSRQSKQSRANSNINNKRPGHVKNKRSLQLGEEQILFEQRLCDHNHGVAVRKIHSNGKSQLRYVKCIPFASTGIHKGSRAGKKQNSSNQQQNMSLSVPDAHVNTSSYSNPTRRNYSSSKSVTSLMGRISLGSKRSKSKASASASGSVSGAQNGYGYANANATVNTNDDTGSRTNTIMTEKQLQKQSMALTWGNKRKVIIPLCNFVAVKKGKTTGRTSRNTCHPSCLLSLITDDKRHGHGSLDIEAPTKLDRDKFAKAFSVFLGIPLKDDFVGEDVNLNFAKGQGQEHGDDDDYMRDEIPDDLSSLPSTSTSTASSVMTPYGLVEYQIGGSLLPSLASSPASPVSRDSSSKLIMEAEDISTTELSIGHGSHNSKMSADSLIDLLPPAVKREHNNADANTDVIKPIPDAKKERKRNDDDNDDRSAVSSLTQGFDQEIVEELHQALNELKAELDASRAEAARAVKVAEQAIQSAESCSSNDWNSTVTHKAAEAAAQAQKRSAEAIAKQRLAEEKLAAERKSAAFWRKQAQSVEDEASALQTRLAVAQVQRAAVTDELDREKHRAASYIQNLKRDYSMQESIQRESLASAAEQNRMLEIELNGTRRDLTAKSEEAKTLFDSVADL